MHQSPPVTTVCYVLGWASLIGGVLLAIRSNDILGDEAGLFTFAVALAPGLIWSVVLWGIGNIADDVSAIRARVRPPQASPPVAPSPPASPING